jgi:hypothetical protein
MTAALPFSQRLFSSIRSVTRSDLGENQAMNPVPATGANVAYCSFSTNVEF